MRDDVVGKPDAEVDPAAAAGPRAHRRTRATAVVPQTGLTQVARALFARARIIQIPATLPRKVYKRNETAFEPVKTN